MAENPRILFPLLSQTNQTLNCSSGFCNSDCPSNCYPEPDYDPPSPPFPAFPELPPLSPAFPQPQDDQIDQISSNVIIIIAVASVLSFFLLVGIYLAANLSSYGRNRTSLRQDSNRDIEEFIDENQVDHPIWFIRTVGLQQSVINSIKIWRYKKDESLIEGTDCLVCLNEFQESETLRILPKCNHAFHISCIDTWLRSHTNCPLCRRLIVSNSIRLNAVSFEANSRNGFDQTQRSDDVDGGSLEMSVGESENVDEEVLMEGEEGEYSKEALESNEDCLRLNRNSNAQIERLDFFEDSGTSNEIIHRDDDQCLNPIRSISIRMESFDLFEGSDQNREVPYPNEDHFVILNRKENTQIKRFDLSEECDQNYEPYGDYSLNSTGNKNIEMKRYNFSERLGFENDKFSDSIQNINIDVKDFESCEDAKEVLDDMGDSSNKLKISRTTPVSKLLHRGPVSMKRSIACGRRNHMKVNLFLSL